VFDPTIEEVHQVQLAHAEKFAFDLQAIFAGLKKQKKESKHKIVKLKPKPAHVVMA
jgi:hypothetical protein